MQVDLQPPQVELHRWDSHGLELTPDCLQIQWSFSVDMPWHVITLTLATPRRRWKERIPRPGDWLVIRHGHDGLAEAFGYVIDRSWGVSTQPKGHVASDAQSLTAIGWWDLFGRTQTYVAPGASSTLRRGTIMSLKRWFDGPWKALSATIDRRTKVGASFASIAKQLGLIRIPDTIADEHIGRATRFAYDARTRRNYCASRPLEPILGPTLTGLYAGLVTNTTALDLLLKTFVADRTLIEVFPTLERMQNTRHMSATGRMLGVQPVVVYRMRPYTASTLAAYVRSATRRRQGARLRSSPSTFQHAGWHTDEAVQVPADAVIRVTGARSDDDHVNAVTVGLPMAQDSVTRFMDKLGLPIYDKEQIDRRGVRMFQPSWPFFPPGADEELVTHTRAVASRAWQVQAGADRFEHGLVEMQYMRALRHGALVNVAVPAEIANKRPGTLVAYVNKVTHTWSLGARNSWMARTSIDYTRGLFDETMREAEFPDAPLVPSQEEAVTSARVVRTDAARPTGGQSLKAITGKQAGILPGGGSSGG